MFSVILKNTEVIVKAGQKTIYFFLKTLLVINKETNKVSTFLFDSADRGVFITDDLTDNVFLIDK